MAVNGSVVTFALHGIATVAIQLLLVVITPGAVVQGVVMTTVPQVRSCPLPRPAMVSVIATLGIETGTLLE